MSAVYLALMLANVLQYHYDVFILLSTVEPPNREQLGTRGFSLQIRGFVRSDKYFSIGGGKQKVH